MEKKDIDLYLSKVNSEATKEEKLEATKELVKHIDESIVHLDKTTRRMASYKIDQDLIDYLVSSSAISIAHEIGMTEIQELSRIVGFIVESSNASNKEDSLKKLREEVEAALQNHEFLGESPTKEQLDIYDGILTRYLYEAIDRGIPVNNIAKDAATYLFSNMPDGMNHRHTLAYQLQILRVMSDREDIGDLIPKLTKEEYREALSNPHVLKSGRLAVLGPYDLILNEYMYHYGQTGEISIEEKSKLFDTLVSNVRPGELINSNAYTKYFSVSGFEDDQKVTYGSNTAIMTDVLARIYENNGRDTRITDFEAMLIDDFYLPHDYNLEQEEPEEYARMKELIPDYSPVLHIESELERHLNQLFIYSASSPEKLARYMIRLQNLFASRNRPKEEKLGKIYDDVISIKIVDALKANLTKDALKEVDPNAPKVDWDEISKILGIEETEEERQRRLETEKALEEIKKDRDPNLSYTGLRRIDYADIAIELMLEADFEEGVKVFANPETIARFSEAGRNIFDSKAARKMVELYVEDPSRYDKNPLAESIIERYVSTVVSKPDFNVFKEQGIAELMQLGNLDNKCYFAKRLIPRIKEIFAKNPAYSMTIDESIQETYDFIKSVGDNSISQDMEAEFDTFLKNLTRIRMVSPNFALPEDVVDFLMSQSMRPESLINFNKEKYGKVAERAIEDLGKIDHLRRNGGKPLSSLYIVRDYLEHEKTMGLHAGDTITIKRERMDQLANGNPDGINTIFHENTHMNQGVRLKGAISSYREYVMLKEDIIRNYDKYDDYYDTNYIMIFKEIEAREVAAGMTAKYLAKIAPKTQEVAIAEAAKADVIDMISERFKREQERYEHESESESKLYIEGLDKKDKDGSTRSVNAIFSDRFRNSYAMNDFIKRVPFAAIEYDSNGKIRPFSEQMAFLNRISDTTFSVKQYGFIKNILKFSQNDKTENSKQSVLALKDLMEASNGKNLQEQFVGVIVSDNYLPVFASFVKDAFADLKAKPSVTEDRIDTYTAVKRIASLVRDNPDAEWTKEFNEKNAKGNSILDMIDLYEKGIKLAHPGMDKAVVALSEARRKQAEERQARIDMLKHSNKPKGLLGIFGKKRVGYKEMAGITADVEGKHAVQNYESVQQHQIDLAEQDIQEQ